MRFLLSSTLIKNAAAFVSLAAAVLAGCGSDPVGKTPDFQYSKCAAVTDVPQYPTPNWLVEADTLTGYRLEPPADDAAAAYIGNKDPWIAALKKLDGFPRMAAWFIAADGRPTALDASKVKLFSSFNGEVKELTGVKFKAEVSTDVNVVAVSATLPLPIPQKGEKYVLALYEGFAAGAPIIPACGAAGTAHPDYVTAANELTRKGFGNGLTFALPTVVSRLSLGIPSLYGELIKAPVLTVKTINEKLVTDFANDYLPDEATKASLQEKAYDGLFTTPLYQDADGVLVQDKTSGLPIKQGETSPGFVIALPKAGTAPYPVVMFQHGGSRNPKDVLYIAKPYADLGFAVMGIDLLYHGSRENATGPKGDAAMADFNAPLKSRDNFRQVAADHLAVQTGISEINKALKGLNGLDKTLDPDKVFFIGHSMGSLSGTISSGANLAMLGTSLLAGGAPYQTMLTEGLFSVPLLGLIMDRPHVEVMTIMNLLETLMDAGDPINHAWPSVSGTGAPKDVLVFASVGDPVMNGPATDYQALSFGCDLALEKDHAVEGMKELSCPASGNYSYAGASQQKATRLIKQIDYKVNTVDRHMAVYLDMKLHRSVAACYEGRIKNGVCVFDYK